MENLNTPYITIMYLLKTCLSQKNIDKEHIIKGILHNIRENIVQIDFSLKILFSLGSFCLKRVK